MNSDTIWPTFPFDPKGLEAAKAEFLANPGWKRIYAAAPEGAKRRLELSFWFSHQDKDNMDYRVFAQYRDYREHIEDLMDVESLSYMAENVGKTTATQHYRQLIEERQHPQPKQMSYREFFKFLWDMGNYKDYRWCGEEEKRVINDSVAAFTRAHELETLMEDILATAKLIEGRTFMTCGWLYVRMSVNLLDKDAQWGAPFQIAALLDARRNLKGYTLLAAEKVMAFCPEGIAASETEAQRLKRQELRERREGETAEA